MGNGHLILFFFSFFFRLGHDLGRGLGLNLARLNGARRALQRQVRAPEKNPISKRAGFGPRAKTRGSGPSMKKLGPNPTRCHS